MHCLCGFADKFMLMPACLCTCGHIIACVSTAPCVNKCICSYAHVAAHVHMFCLATKRWIIVSCQGDNAGEVELLTHMSAKEQPGQYESLCRPLWPLSTVTLVINVKCL